MYLERTMYKVLFSGLLLAALGAAVHLLGGIADLVFRFRGEYSPFLYQSSFDLIVLAGRFLIALAMLYWAPKFIKKFFPEVS